MSCVYKARPKGLGRAGTFVSGLAVLCWSAASVFGAVDPGRLPPPAKSKVDFAKDVQPIIEGACLKCHSGERPKGKFSLTTRQTALKGGQDQVDIIAGNSAKSPLIHFVARVVADSEMPPVDKGTPLTPDEVGTLRAWIDQAHHGRNNLPLARPLPPAMAVRRIPFHQPPARRSTLPKTSSRFSLPTIMPLTARPQTAGIPGSMGQQRERFLRRRAGAVIVPGKAPQAA